MVQILIEAAKIAALSAMRPIFMSLISGLLNPKFLMSALMDLAEMAAKHTETQFDDEKLKEFRKLVEADLDKQVEKKD